MITVEAFCIDMTNQEERFSFRFFFLAAGTMKPMDTHIHRHDSYE